MTCPFGCQTTAPHDTHLFHEPGSPYAMRIERNAVALWLPSGEVLRRRQPDAIHKLRADVRAIEQSGQGERAIAGRDSEPATTPVLADERQQWAFEDATDNAAKAALL